MKKIILLILLGIMILSQTHADDCPVRPFAVEGKVWFLRTGTTYIIQGDTIISSQTYKRLYQYQVGKELTYIGCLRDEATLFDLQGRRLATPPARGVYIKNGKKVIR